MSVHLRERPVIRQALRAGLPQRLAPAALRAGAAVLGCMGACAPLLGGMHPIGLCFAMSAPTPYALYMAAGAAVGALWGLPLELAAPYLAAAATVGLLRGLAFAHRQRTAAMAPAAAGSIVFCLIASGLAVAGARGLPGVCAAAAEAMLILGASYLLAGFFLSARHGGVAAENAPWDAEDRACLCFACLSLLCCLTPYAVFGLSLAHVAAALVVLAAAGRGRQDAAAVLAVVSMLALCAADPAGLYAGLGIAAGGLVAGLFAGRPRPVTAAAFCAGGRAAATPLLPLKAGNGVGYTVPQQIRMENIGDGVPVFFRVRAVYRDAKIVVRDAEGTQIAAFPREHLAPGEMETIRLPRVLLQKAAGALTVEVEKGGEGA